MYIAESQDLPFFYSYSLLVNRRKITSFYSHFTYSETSKTAFYICRAPFSVTKITRTILAKYDILQINREVECDILQVEVPFEYDKLALYRNSSNLCPSPLLGYVSLSSQIAQSHY